MLVSSHVTPLRSVGSMPLRPIVDVFGVVSRVTEFLRASSKRVEKLESLIHNVPNSSLARKKRLQTLSETRCVERHDTI